MPFLGKRNRAAESRRDQRTVSPPMAGAALFVAGLLLFLIILANLNGNLLMHVDQRAATLIRHWHTPWGMKLSLAISWLGTWGAWLVVLLVARGLLSANRRPQARLLVLANLWGTVLLYALKLAIHRPRPDGLPPLIFLSFSFPSGHAFLSLVAYGTIAWLTGPRKATRTQHGIAVCAMVLVLLIGLSRIYLGVHYLSDVIGGYAAAMAWLGASIAWTEMNAGGATKAKQRG